MALLTPAEAARELRISTKHLRALTRAGLIRYVNIGLGQKRESRRYHPEDLRQFQEEGGCRSTDGSDYRSTPSTAPIRIIDFRDQQVRKATATPKGSKKK